MRKQTRYCSTADLKRIREILLYSKDSVAEKINYSVRTLERIEKENAVRDVETAQIMCDLYGLEFKEHFFECDIKTFNTMSRFFSEEGDEPKNIVLENSVYYFMFIRRLKFGNVFVASKLRWIANYNRNKERRIICEVNASAIRNRYPDIVVINTEREWKHWFYRLCVGKMHRVIISENCVRNCLKYCLEEVIVKNEDLLYLDGVTDVYIFS